MNFHHHTNRRGCNNSWRTNYLLSVYILILVFIVHISTAASQPTSPRHVRLSNIDFSEASPYIQHLDAYISLKTQQEVLPNVLLIQYYPWDSTASYDIRKAIIEMVLEFKEKGLVFETFKGETLHGLTLSPNDDPDDASNKFLIRVVNNHNMIDGDFSKKYSTTISPVVKFLTNGTDKSYFFSYYSSELFKRFVLLALTREITVSGYQDICLDGKINPDIKEDVLNNVLQYDQVLIGYFPNTEKEDPLYLEKYYNSTFSFVQPLRMKFVAVYSGETLSQFFGCLPNLYDIIRSTESSKVVLYNIVKDSISLYASDSKLLTDWVVEKYDPLISEIQSRNYQRYEEYNEKVILFVDKRNDKLMNLYKRFSYIVHVQHNSRYKVCFVEGEFSYNLYRQFVYSKNGSQLSAINMPENQFPSLMIRNGKDIYILDKCFHGQFDKLNRYLECFNLFLKDPSSYIHHNSKETANSVSYVALSKILSLHYRPKLTLVFVYSSTGGNTRYFNSMIDEVLLENEPFLDVFKLDTKYNDVPELLFKDAPHLNTKKVPQLFLIPNYNEFSNIHYDQSNISHTLLRRWIAEGVKKLIMPRSQFQEIVLS